MAVWVSEEAQDAVVEADSPGAEASDVERYIIEIHTILPASPSNISQFDGEAGHNY